MEVEEQKAILDSREEFYIFEIEIKNNERIVSCIKVRLYDYTIEYINFQDTEFYNNLESLLVQWSLFSEQDDFYIRTVFVNEEKALIEKKKLASIWCSLNTKMSNLKIMSNNNENDLFKNLLKEEEENRITCNKVKKNLNILIQNEGFLDTNAFYKKFKVKIFNSEEFLKIDKSVFESLSLFDKNKEDNKSVYSYIRKFVNTSMGQRVLKQWIFQPPKKIDEIFYRQKTVKMYLENKELLKLMDSFLEVLPDLDKILVKFLRFNNNMRNTASLKDCYQISLFVRKLKEILPKIQKYRKSDSEDFLISVLIDIVKDLSEAAEFTEKSIDIEKIESSNEFFINCDFSENLKDLNNQINKRKRHIQRIQSELKDELSEDIKINNNLKIGTVFEMKKNNAFKEFEKNKNKFKILTTRKTTITFTIPELDNINEELNELKELYEKEQKNHIQKVIKFVANFYDAIQTTNFIFIEQDILIGFAKMYENPKDDNSFCIPTFIEREPASNYQKLKINKAWHLCIDGCIANDIDLERDNKEMIVITGPNMGGKSTYLRTIALCILLAHMGCPVPAQSCELTIFSSIHTRVGASDMQLKGISTFMNEMIETSNMINSADCFSLIVIDELGRGTSVYEGLGISQAIMEFVVEKLNCFCLFATHFCEITKLEEKYKVVKNYSMEVLDLKNEVLFTYKLKQGAVEKSYGIQILRNLEFPKEITDDAETLLNLLEKIKIDNLI